MNKNNLIISIAVIVAILAIGSYMFISANTKDTQIEILSNSTLENGDSFEFILKDTYRNPIPDEVVDVKIIDDNGWANKYAVSTDKDGMGSVKLNAMGSGNYTVHCDFNGTMFLKASSQSGDLTINGY